MRLAAYIYSRHLCPETPCAVWRVCSDVPGDRVVDFQRAQTYSIGEAREDGSHDGSAHLGSIGLLLVGVSSLLADAITRIFANEIDIRIVGCQSDYRLAAQDSRRIRPNVIVLDEGVWQYELLEIVARIRAESPTIRLILLHSSADAATASLMARVGAARSLNHDISVADLIDAIQEAMRGPNYVAVASLVELLDAPPSHQRLTSRLAGREVEILRAAAVGGSTEEIAVQLHISIHTVRAHFKNVMGKLGTHSRLESVVVAIRDGIIPPPV
jgi:two-component system, NarL family, response regulator